jgi:gas vesicle protein
MFKGKSLLGKTLLLIYFCWEVNEKFFADTSSLKENSIEQGTKIHLVIKKDTESNLSRELKQISKKYVADVDQFAAVFNQEMKRLVNEMSLDDIERYDEARAATMQSN